MRQTDEGLVVLLEENLVLTHPLVWGELAGGNVSRARRRTILDAWDSLPKVVEARNDEVVHLLEQHKLWGKGLGWAGLSLLAAAQLTPCWLWTRDRALQQAAERLEVFYIPQTAQTAPGRA